jgi:hypothetical protein
LLPPNKQGRARVTHKPLPKADNKKESPRPLLLCAQHRTTHVSAPSQPEATKKHKEKDMKAGNPKAGYSVAIPSRHQ